MDRIGSLFLYRIPSRQYTQDEIKAAFATEKMRPLCEVSAKDGALIVPHLPSAPHDADAFRKACSIVARDYRSVKDKFQRTVKIRITDVNSDKQWIQKDIVQEIVRGKTLGTTGLHQNVIEESIAKITFRHSVPGDITNKLRIIPTVPMEEAIQREIWAPGVNYVEMFAQLQDTLVEVKSGISDVQFRAWIGDMMKWKLGGRSFSPVRGTHFLPPGEASELFVEGLRQIDGVFAQLVPVYDEGTTLQDMANHFNEEIEAEIRTLVEEIDIKKGMRSDKIKRVARELAYYGEQVASYSSMQLADKGRVTALLAQAGMQLQMAATAADTTKEKNAAERAYRREREASLPKMERKGLFDGAA